MKQLVPIRVLMELKADDGAWAPDPPAVDMPLYEEAIAWMVERGRQIGGVRAVCDLGPIRYPGLSDIDLLYVVDEARLDVRALETLKRMRVPERFHAALLHDPYLVRERDLARIFEFTPILQLRPRWDPDGLCPAAKNEDALNLTLTLAEITAESYPHEFARLLLRRPWDARELVSRLKGLGYCIDLLRRLHGRGFVEADEFAAHVEALRGAWCGLPAERRREQTLALTRQAIGLSLRLAMELADALAAAWGMRVGGTLLLPATRTPACYVEHPESWDHACAVRIRQMDTCAAGPALLGWVVREAARTDGPVGRRLTRRMIDRLRVEGEPPKAVTRALGRRAALREDHTRWLDSVGLGFPAFLAKGYLTRDVRRGMAQWRRLAGRACDHLRERQMRALMSAMAGANGERK